MVQLLFITQHNISIKLQFPFTVTSCILHLADLLEAEVYQGGGQRDRKFTNSPPHWTVSWFVSSFVSDTSSVVSGDKFARISKDCNMEDPTWFWGGIEPWRPPQRHLTAKR